MAFDIENGTVSIDLADFWMFVQKYLPDFDGAEIAYGVPRVNKSNSTIEIDYSVSTEGTPYDWVNKPKAVLQWEEI